MRFKTFLTEARGVELDRNAAIDYARKNCMAALEFKYHYVLRGIGSNFEYYLAKPSSSTRISANTSNEYTTIIDNMAAWKKFPKRSKSVICTTVNHFEYARNFGKPMIVIPKDGATFGIASEADFWDSFPYIKRYWSEKTEPTLEDLNFFITRMAAYCDVPFSKSNSDFSVLSNAFDEMTKKIQDPEIFKEFELNISYSSLLREVTSKKLTFLQLMQKLLDPKKNDISIGNYESLKQYSDVNLEVWTDSDCLMISTDDDGSMMSSEDLDHLYGDFRQDVFNEGN